MSYVCATNSSVWYRLDDMPCGNDSFEMTVVEKICSGILRRCIYVHDDVTAWKQYWYYRPFVREIHMRRFGVSFVVVPNKLLHNSPFAGDLWRQNADVASM